MKYVSVIAPLFLASALAASCSEVEDPEDRTEDRIEQVAEQSAVAAGDVPAALGMTEWQLLDAEIIDASGAEIGDVERVLRDANGQVDRLLVEIEDSNPDRYVVVPIEGMTTVVRGDDTDLKATMTRAQVEAMPDADLTAM